MGSCAPRDQADSPSAGLSARSTARIADEVRMFLDQPNGQIVLGRCHGYPLGCRHRPRAAGLPSDVDLLWVGARIPPALQGGATGYLSVYEDLAVFSDQAQFDRIMTSYASIASVHVLLPKERSHNEKLTGCMLTLIPPAPHCIPCTLPRGRFHSGKPRRRMSPPRFRHVRGRLRRAAGEGGASRCTATRKEISSQ